MVPFCLLFAESEGFKPPIPGKGIPDFESSAFGHSANFPFVGAKVAQKADTTKFIGKKFSPTYYEVARLRIYGCLVLSRRCCRKSEIRYADSSPLQRASHRSS